MTVFARRVCAASALLLAALAGCDDDRAPSLGPSPSPDSVGSRSGSAPPISRPPVATATDTGTYAPPATTPRPEPTGTTEPAGPEQPSEETATG